MCDIATGMAIATMGVGLLQNVGKQQQGREQYAANKASAQRNYRFQMKGLTERRQQESQNFALRQQQIGLRTVQERGKTSRQLLTTTREGNVVAGKMKGSIVQRGITGTTAEAILRDVQRRNLEQMNAAIQDGDQMAQNLQYQNFLNIHKYENLQTQLNLQEEGYGYQMDNQINSVGNPSDMDFFLGMMGTGLNAAETYTNMGGQWGKKKPAPTTNDPTKRVDTNYYDTGIPV